MTAVVAAWEKAMHPLIGLAQATGLT